ncbi:MAG: hypothetical protein LBP39_03145 [Rickettsiales bacterium]|nr:hypothetical protein [Rickettsiales bacterium]
MPSCANITHRYVTSGLQAGSTREEAVLAMGYEPAEKKSFGGRDVMVYYLYSSIFDFIINGDKFPFFGFYPLLATGQEFWIILNKDKVEAFGYARNFGYSLKNIENSQNRGSP